MTPGQRLALYLFEMAVLIAVVGTFVRLVQR